MASAEKQGGNGRHERGLAVCNSKDFAVAFEEWWRGWSARGGAACDPETNARAAAKAFVQWIYQAGLDPRAEYLRYDEVESLFGLNRTKTFELIRAGVIRSAKIGEIRLIEVASLRVFIQTQIDFTPGNRSGQSRAPSNGVHGGEAETQRLPDTLEAAGEQPGKEVIPEKNRQHEPVAVSTALKAPSESRGGTGPNAAPSLSRIALRGPCGKLFMFECEALAHSLDRSFAINPRLPAGFDATDNEHRPDEQRAWWNVPFIQTCTSDDPQWRAHWKSGIRYDVRCLDGGAWDRSTCWGMFGTLDEALGEIQRRTIEEAA